MTIQVLLELCDAEIGEDLVEELEEQVPSQESAL